MKKKKNTIHFKFKTSLKTADFKTDQARFLQKWE